MSRVVDYISGTCRNEPEARKAHLYAKTAAGHLWPMCDLGWNRSDGAAFSILRGWGSSKGTCKTCAKNVALKKRPVIRPRKHKTRWI